MFVPAADIACLSVWGEARGPLALCWMIYFRFRDRCFWFDLQTRSKVECITSLLFVHVGPLFVPFFCQHIIISLILSSREKTDITVRQKNFLVSVQGVSPCSIRSTASLCNEARNVFFFFLLPTMNTAKVSLSSVLYFDTKCICWPHLSNQVFSRFNEGNVTSVWCRNTASKTEMKETNRCQSSVFLLCLWVLSIKHMPLRWLYNVKKAQDLGLWRWKPMYLHA